MKSVSRKYLAIAALVAVVLMAQLTGCALFSKTVDNLNSLMQGRSATVSTYNVFGEQLDRIHGVSVDIERDTTFDSTNSDGSNNADSSVVDISVGENTMVHVGATLLMVQDGIIDVSGQLPATVDLNNTQRGTPLMNYLYQSFTNLWQGKARTLLVRSQNGSPIAIFAGAEVEYFATNIPKSTLFRIDGNYLLVYRGDYTLYDNDALKNS